MNDTKQCLEANTRLAIQTVGEIPQNGHFEPWRHFQSQLTCLKTVPLVAMLLVGGLLESPLQAENLVTNGIFEIRKSGEPNCHIDTLTPDREDLVGWRVTGRSIDWVGPTRWKASHGEHCLDLDAIGFIQVRAYPLSAYFDDDN